MSTSNRRESSGGGAPTSFLGVETTPSGAPIFVSTGGTRPCKLAALGAPDSWSYAKDSSPTIVVFSWHRTRRFCRLPGGWDRCNPFFATFMGPPV
jgi:hypothetical protein